MRKIKKKMISLMPTPGVAIKSIIVALIVIGFIVSIGLAVGGVFSPGTTTSGDINKGLIGHWPLDGEGEKVGSSLNTGTFAKRLGGSGTLTGASSTGFTSFVSGIQYDRVGVSLSASLIVGKTYRLTWTGLTSTSGNVQIRTYTTTNMLDAEGSELYLGIISSNTIDFVATEAASIIGLKNLSHPTTITLSGFSIKEIQTADVTPNANHGVVYGTTQNANDITLDGTDYILIPDTPEPTNTMSVFGWQKGVAQNQKMVASHYDYGASKRMWSIGTTTSSPYDKLEVVLSSDGSATADKLKKYTTTSTVFDDTWHFVGFTWDNGTLTLYVDGIEADVTKTLDNAFTDFYDSNPSVSIGSLLNNGVGAFLFTGSIKDVRIYNRALSTDEIEQLYNLGGRQNQITSGSLYKDLVLDMPLDSASEKVGSEVINDAQATSYDNEANATTSWTSHKDGGDGPTITSQSGDVKFGNYALQVVYPATGVNARMYHYISPQLIQGKKYYVSMWSKYVSGSGSVTIGMADNTYADDHIIGSVTSSNTDWTKYGLEFTADVNTIYLALRTASYNTPTILVDGFSIKEIQTADATPNANHGIVYGTTQNSDSMTFDGISDYINIGDSTVLDITDTISISAWVTPTDLSDNMMIAGRDDVTNRNYDLWFNASGDAYFIVFNGGTAYVANTGVGTITAGNTYHLVGTYDGSNVKIYINTVVSSTPCTGSIDNDNVPFFIGARYNATAVYQDFFKGNIQDVRVYNRALSSDEVSQLYNLGGRQNQITTGSLYKGLVLDMPLKSANEKIGSELITLSNNTNFESGSIGSWYWVSPDSGTGTVTYSADSPNAGDKSGKVTITHAQYARAALDSTLVGALTDGKTYRVGMDAYLPSGNHFTGVSLGGSAFTGAVATSDFPVDTTKVNQWQRTSILFTPSSDITGYFYIQFYNTSYAADGEFLYFDNVSIKPFKTADTTPNANHGTVYGATVGSDSTSFDGTNDYVVTGDDSTTGTSISMSTWIKTSYDNTTVDNGIVGKWDTGEGKRAYVLSHDVTTNYLSFLTSPDGFYSADNRIYYTTAINDGEWHHVVGVHDGSSNYLYVDGDLKSSADVANGIYNTSQSICAGVILNSNSPLANSYFNGEIFDVKIYNRILNSDEVKSLYDKGR